jgi:chromosomal replication initiator protein
MVLPIAEETLGIIANRVRDNICHLEGALTYLDARAKLTGLDLTPQIVNKLLTSSKSIDDRQMILHVTSNYFDCSVEQILGKKRDKETVLARHVTMYIMREEGNYSFAEISKVLGDRNHSTVLHGYKKISGELKANSKLRKQINEIKQKIINNSC